MTDEYAKTETAEYLSTNESTLQIKHVIGKMEINPSDSSKYPNDFYDRIKVLNWGCSVTANVGGVFGTGVTFK